jgi:hypothetical protein
MRRRNSFSPDSGEHQEDTNILRIGHLLVGIVSSTDISQPVIFRRFIFAHIPDCLHQSYKANVSGNKKAF